MNASIKKKLFVFIKSKINKKIDKFIFIFRFINLIIILTFKRILQNEIKIELKKIMNMCFQLYKLFLQRYKKTKKFQFYIDTIRVEFIEMIKIFAKNYYFAFTSKVSIKIKFETKYIALLNTKIEINVMIEKIIIIKKCS